ncbi:MAG: zinc-binding dehydrogenase [Acidobacteriota bacterium]|nr:MAG: zinc-binding dehydrogenase [Acidobacteriota bacterium]
MAGIFLSGACENNTPARLFSRGLASALQTMKTRAIFIEHYGRPNVLVNREVPLPQLGPTDVHLRVEAAGVNFADLLMRAGLYGTVPPLPFSPGFEVAGRIMRAGKQVEGWKEGDRAVAVMRFGGYDEDVIVPATQLCGYPASLTSAEAAGVPVVFLTAWVCLFEAARARRGETALVLGAGGGVGTAAVQLAVRHGLRAIGTAGSPRKREFVTKELGAEACFDSRSDWEAEVCRLVGKRRIDLALDPVGGRATASCRRLLAPLGRLIFYGLSDAVPRDRRSWPRAVAAWLRTPWFHPLSLVEPNVGLHGVHLLHLGHKEPILSEALLSIFQAIGDGLLRPIIDRTFPLDSAGAARAHTYLHARSNLGKVVLVTEPVNGEENV